MERATERKVVSGVIGLLLVLVAGQPLAAQESTGEAAVGVRKGPYLIYPGNNTEMMVLWQLDAPQPLTLRWGRDCLHIISARWTSTACDNAYYGLIQADGP